MQRIPKYQEYNTQSLHSHSTKKYNCCELKNEDYLALSLRLAGRGRPARRHTTYNTTVAPPPSSNKIIIL